MGQILVVSIIAVGVLIERFIFLYFKYNINAPAFMAQIQKLVMAGNIDRAIKLCNAQPSAALARVVKAGLMRANKGEAAIGAAISEAQLEVVPLVTRRTNSLLVYANVATLLGLLGTIVGLIQAFDALEGAAPEERQNLLAAGISVAMYTTAYGLIVAIPVLLMHLFLSGITKRIIEELDEYSTKLENLLVAQAQGRSTEE
jgi:biopolymer transport protein ExbB/TolQ